MTDIATLTRRAHDMWHNTDPDWRHPDEGLTS